MWLYCPSCTAQVLYSFLGKDAVNVSIGSEGGPAYGLRNFTSLKAIADEVGHSRALGGVVGDWLSRVGFDAVNAVHHEQYRTSAQQLVNDMASCRLVNVQLAGVALPT